MSTDSVKFELESVVYFRTDEDAKGVITGIMYRPTGTQYFVTWSAGIEHCHYACELTTEKPFAETKA